MTKRVCLVIVAAWLAITSATAACAAQRVSLMFASNHAFSRTSLDSTLRSKLAQSGLDLQVDTCNYPELTAERLSKCNLLIMTYPSGVAARLLGAVPAILEYVKSGGGLIVITDECADSRQLLNEFLSQVDAKVVPEIPVDSATLFQQAGFVRHWYCSTSNIRQHPITQGVNTLFYPLADSTDNGRGTLALELGEEWTPLIFGNLSAYYVNYETGGKEENAAPKPILGIRDYGKGRIIEFSTRSLNFFHQPYHKIFEGICLERGDGLKLVINMIRWTAEPSIASGNPGGFVEPVRKVAAPAFDPKQFDGMDYYQKAYYVGLKKAPNFPLGYDGPYDDGMSDFVGLVGAHTSYSRGEADPYAEGVGTVKDYCDIAKQKGYGFIAFAEVFENMTEQKWNQLVADCKAESGTGFIAIPGIEMKDVVGDSWITVDPPRWPSSGLNAAGNRGDGGPGYYFGLVHSETGFVGHIKLLPKSSRTKPWVTKFYSGLDVFSYNNETDLLSEALDYYLRAQGNNFNLIPVTTHRLRNPYDVFSAGGVLTHVRASSATEIPLKFRAPWYGDREAYLSAGPKLAQWRMENGRAYRDEEWRLLIGVHSDVSLKLVTLYDREKPFRVFRPNSAVFQTTVAGYHDSQHFFVLVAEDVEGRKLVSPARYTSDPRQSLYMCTDMQNTLNSAYDIDAEGKEQQYFGVGYGVTNWEGVEVICTTPNLLPESGMELGYGRCRVNSSAYLPGLEGNRWAISARDLAFGSGDYCALVNTYDWVFSPYQNEIADTPSLYAVSRHTCFTPRMNGLNVFRVQHYTTLLRDYDLPAGSKSQWMTALRIELDYNNAFPKYALVDESGKKTLGTRDASTNMDVTLKPGSYFASYPAMWGPFAAFPLGTDMEMRVRGGSIEFGHEITGSVKAGTKFYIDTILVVGKYDSLDEKDYDQFRSAFGLDGLPAYGLRVTHGKLLDTKYELKLQADGGWAAANISAANMGCDLPINVHGLNENWDAGMLDLDSGKLRRVAVYQGNGIFQHNIDRKPLRFVCGSLVVCDNPEVKLNLFQRNGKWSCDVHNPTSKAAKVHVRIPEWLQRVAPRLDKSLTVPAGATKTIYL